jgi:hypothetical protein
MGSGDEGVNISGAQHTLQLEGERTNTMKPEKLPQPRGLYGVMMTKCNTGSWNRMSRTF